MGLGPERQARPSRDGHSKDLCAQSPLGVVRHQVHDPLDRLRPRARPLLGHYFAVHHGERIAHDVGIDPRRQTVDLEGFRASLGLTEDVEHLTHRDLQHRRETIRKRMEEHHRRRH